MPRDVNGIYTLPSGNPVVPGTTVSSDWANQTMQDIATALTGSLSVPGSVTPDHLNLNAAGFRSKIGLGNVAILNTGTSGATVPLCNGANTWSAAQAFSSTVNITGALVTGSTATFGAAVTVNTGNFQVSNGQSNLNKATQTITDWTTAAAISNGAPDAMIAFQVPGVRAGALGITGDNELSWKTNADGTNYYKVWTAKNFNPATKQDALGYTPVRQGGGALMGNNPTYIGWRSDATLGLRIDSTEFGNTWPINISGSAPTLGGVAASSYMRKDIAQTTNSDVVLNNGSGDAPNLRWITSGAGAMSFDLDCIGGVFRAFANGVDSDGTTCFRVNFADASVKSFGRNMKRGTFIDSTQLSGTSKDIPVPSWANRIKILMWAVSSTGNSQPCLLFAGSAGIEASGYGGAISTSASGGGGTSSVLSSSHLLHISTAAANQNVMEITMSRFDLQGNSTWITKSCTASLNSTITATAVSQKTLTGNLSTIRMQFANGADSFDTGYYSVYFED